MLISCQDCHRTATTNTKRCAYCNGSLAAICTKCGGVRHAREFKFGLKICECKDDN